MTRQQSAVPIIGVPNPDDGDESDRREFIEAMSTQVSQVLTEPGELWVEYEVLSQPTTIFVSSDGSIEVHSGALGPQEMLKRIEALS